MLIKMLAVGTINKAETQRIPLALQRNAPHTPEPLSLGAHAKLLG